MLLFHNANKNNMRESAEWMGGYQVVGEIDIPKVRAGEMIYHSEGILTGYERLKLRKYPNTI